MVRPYSIFLGILFITIFNIQAQEKDNIGTQVVNVVKPYTPTISDAYKIKEIPSVLDSVTTQKKEINYSIFSVPVASTFTPAKGKADVLQKSKKEKLYNSYALLGVGNYKSLVADFYTGRALSRNEMLDISITHHSAQGDIKDVALENSFYNTKAEGVYTNRSRDMYWSARAGFQHQLYNWYGLPTSIFYDASIYAAEEKQSYYNGFAQGNVVFNNAVFKSGEMQIRRFWDDYSSNENRLLLIPQIEVPVGKEQIQLYVKTDYVGGEFKNGYNTTSAKPYSFFQIGATPQLIIASNNITLNLGASIVFGGDIENNKNSFYIYPKVTASYKLVDEYVIVYGGVEGQLQQNSYYNFVENNPYVSPTLTILPTDEQYNAYVGLKGKLQQNVGYNIKGTYIAQNNKPLYRLNAVNNLSVPNKGYTYGNSFGVVYDDVKTLSVFGELTVDVTHTFTMGVNAEFFDYTTDKEVEPWNLPLLKGAFFTDYKINDSWNIGGSVFYIGERKDFLQNTNIATQQTLILDSYFDANVYSGYNFNEQLSVFIKLNNLTNNSYTKWANYNVMGFQVMGGITYKFDW